MSGQVLLSFVKFWQTCFFSEGKTRIKWLWVCDYLHVKYSHDISIQSALSFIVDNSLQIKSASVFRSVTSGIKGVKLGQSTRSLCPIAQFTHRSVSSCEVPRQCPHSSLLWVHHVSLSTNDEVLTFNHLKSSIRLTLNIK